MLEEHRSVVTARDRQHRIYHSGPAYQDRELAEKLFDGPGDFQRDANNAYEKGEMKHTADGVDAQHIIDELKAKSTALAENNSSANAQFGQNFRNLSQKVTADAAGPLLAHACKRKNTAIFWSRASVSAFILFHEGLYHHPGIDIVCAPRYRRTCHRERERGGEVRQ